MVGGRAAVVLNHPPQRGVRNVAPPGYTGGFPGTREKANKAVSSSRTEESGGTRWKTSDHRRAFKEPLTWTLAGLLLVGIGVLDVPVLG